MTEPHVLALRNFRAALEGDVASLRRLGQQEFVARCLELCGGHADDPDAQLGPSLLAAARAGSIEALRQEIEGWADEEVAAGRMTVSRGPNGEKVYSSVNEAPE